MKKRLELFGAPVDSLSYEQALDRMTELAVASERAVWAVAVNPEKVMAARRNESLRRFLQDSALAFPDGIGVVFACRLIYGARLERTPGADLMESLCARGGACGLKFFFFGSSEDVNARAVDVLLERYPDMTTVGRRNGYVNESEYPALVEQINRSGANIFIVALGSPKQEEWIARYADELRVGLCLGVGGTLDTLAGRVKRAPLWWRNNHLEWLYRLARQPGRFWRQRRIFYFAILTLCLAALRPILRRGRKI